MPHFCEGSINGPKLSEDALKFSGLSEHGLSHISMECLNMGQFRGQAWPSTIYIMLGPLVGWLVGWLVRLSVHHKIKNLITWKDGDIYRIGGTCPS